MKRPLGAAEQLVWMAGLHRTTQFAIAVQLRGELDIQRLQNAFDDVCSNVLFRSGFEVDDSGVPWLAGPRSHGIIVELKEGNPSEWSSLLAKEVSTPLLDDECLVRVSVLKARREASLVICAHHSLVDGISVVVILDAIMKHVAGKAYDLSVPGISLEDMAALSRPAGSGGNLAPLRPSFREMGIRPPGSVPVVTNRVLDTLATAKLRAHARQMGVTVYSAVCAALGAAMTKLSGDRDPLPYRFICPIDLRRWLHGDQRAVGMYATSATVESEGASDVWAAARAFSRALDPYKSPANLAAGIYARKEVVAGIGTPEEATRLLGRSGAEFLVSNLGDLDPFAHGGDLNVEAVWGPSVNLGTEALQTIGMATYAGELHLLHSTYRPVEGLLDTALSILLRDDTPQS